MRPRVCGANVSSGGGALPAGGWPRAGQVGESVFCAPLVDPSSSTPAEVREVVKSFKKAGKTTLETKVCVQLGDDQVSLKPGHP